MDLGSDFSGRAFQFETFNDPQPSFIRDSKKIDPSTSEIMEGIPASFTTEPLADDPIYFIPNYILTQKRR